MLRELKSVHNEVVLVNQLMSLFTDANSASQAIAFHLVRNEHILAKNIIAYHFGSNDTTHYFPSMYADPHIQVPQSGILCLVPLLRDYIDHF